MWGELGYLPNGLFGIVGKVGIGGGGLSNIDLIGMGFD